MQKIWLKIGLLLVCAIVIRFGVLPLMQAIEVFWSQVLIGLMILSGGAILVLHPAAAIIEETTDVLSQRTQLASGLLQSIGTAFPDMALGVVAAMISLQLRSTDMVAAINYAVIAAATTFGSNIYNIGHAVWCVWRQNHADAINRKQLMFPFWRSSGYLIPLRNHAIKPSITELQVAQKVLVALSVLTMTVVLSMVMFGGLGAVAGQNGDMYQLTRPLGFIVAILSGWLLYVFRQNQRSDVSTTEIMHEKSFFIEQPTFVILLQLILAGIAILFAAESMIHAIAELSLLLHIPITISGVVSGLVGCLGEIIVVHNFSVNPSGRIGDAVMGVAMDNIVTTLGAAIVAIMGGIFLGGSSLIMIFTIVLTLNAVLIWQVGELQSRVAVFGN